MGHSFNVKLWDAASGDCLKELHGHEGILGAAAFSLNGAILASGRSDCQIRLWDIATGDCLQVLEGHTNGITSLQFLPLDPSLRLESQPQILVSGSHDETIRLWDIATGTCLQILRPDRLYEGMNITGMTGLTQGAIATLKQLGAVEQ